jgi:C1A family cysteine protease
MKRRLGLVLLCLASHGYAEKLRYSTGLVVPADHDLGVPYLSFNEETKRTDLPEKYDLRDLGAVSPVRNQGSCGSCWAFAGIAVMESALLVNGVTDKSDLSEQDVVSCDSSNSGCGGWQPFDYMVNRGVTDEASFPYAGRNLRCKATTPVAKAVSWGNVGSSNRAPTVNEMRQAIVEFGAIWVAVAAGGWGNVGEVKTSCGSSRLNHAVTIVGYEPDGKGSYNFIVKNSWGSSWAKDGFVKMRLGCDRLGAVSSFVVPAEHKCAAPSFNLPKIVSKAKTKSLAINTSLISLYSGKTRMSSNVSELSEGEYTAQLSNSCGTWEQKFRVTE